MYNLTAVDAYRPPVREEIYVLDIVALAAGPVTVSSDQRLSAFDAGAGLACGPARSWQTAHGNVACARGFGAGGPTAGGGGGAQTGGQLDSVVCTAGEDGSVALWDLRVDGPQAQVARLTDNHVPILSLACSGAGYTVVAGTELQHSQASILIWDVRSTPTPRHQYNEVHSDDITVLNFHPADPNILLSGSTDGLVNVCDTRVADEDEAVVQALNPGASVHRAAFLNATELYALSHDERLALYDVAEGFETGAAKVDFGDVRAALGGGHGDTEGGCQYVADISPKANGAGAVVGAGAHDRQMFELVHLTNSGSGSGSGGGGDWVLDRENSVGLPGAHGSDIVRSFCFYDEAGTVFTAGEDGFIRAWR